MAPVHGPCFAVSQCQLFTLIFNQQRPPYTPTFIPLFRYSAIPYSAFYRLPCSTFHGQLQECAGMLSQVLIREWCACKVRALLIKN